MSLQQRPRKWYEFHETFSVSAQFKLTVFSYEALCFFNSFDFVQIAGQQDRLREQGDALAAQAQALAMLQGHVAKLEESIANSSRGQRQAADSSSNQQLSSLPRLRELRSAATSPLPPLPSSPRPSPTRTAAQQVFALLLHICSPSSSLGSQPCGNPHLSWRGWHPFFYEWLSRSSKLHKRLGNIKHRC